MIEKCHWRSAVVFFLVCAQAKLQLTDEDRGGLRLQMDDEEHESLRKGTFKVDRQDFQDECTFHSTNLHTASIEFRCSSSSILEEAQDEQQETSKVDPRWEWCGFRWEVASKDHFELDLYPCEGEILPLVRLSEDRSNKVASEAQKATLKSFLTSRVASHFVHFGLVAAMEGHSGHQSVPMLYLFNLSKVFVRSTKYLDDLSEWHNEGDFADMLDVANSVHGATDRALQEEPNSFKEVVVEPSHRSLRRLTCHTGAYSVDPVNRCGNRCFGRCGNDCECWYVTLLGSCELYLS